MNKNPNAYRSLLLRDADKRNLKIIQEKTGIMSDTEIIRFSLHRLAISFLDKEHNIDQQK